MREGKSKGKQKIIIQKIEKPQNRSVTFSKRKSGIHTKLSEISVACGADVGFLVKSSSGKLYTYGNPSFDAVAKRFLNGDLPEGAQPQRSSSSSSIINAHKNLKMKEQCKAYNDLAEKLHEAEKKVVTMKKTALSMDTDSWWNTNPRNDDEEATRLLVKFEELYKNLREVAAAKSHRGNGASTSQMNNNNRHG